MSHNIILRDVQAADLPLFYEFQLDAEANHMAAFVAKDHADRAAFDAHWQKITNNPEIVIKTILQDGRVVGSVLSYVQMGEREVSYWLDKGVWGRGIATQALAEYVRLVTERPLYARAVKDNVASRRVLEKCGFRIVGEDKAFANARNAEVEEFVFQLD